MFDYGFEACGRLFQYNVFWDVGFAAKDPNIVKVRDLPITSDPRPCAEQATSGKAVLATNFANFEKGEWGGCLIEPFADLVVDAMLRQERCSTTIRTPFSERGCSTQMVRAAPQVLGSTRFMISRCTFR